MPHHSDTALTPRELLNELHALVDEAEQLMGDSIAAHGTDTISALRARYTAAQERMSELYACARQRAVTGARCTDAAIREHPYRSLALAAGAGLLAGLLLGRRR